MARVIDEQPGQQEGVPGEPAEHAAGEVGRDGRGRRIRDAYDREPDAVPPPEGCDPLRPSQGNQRGNRYGYVEAQHAAGTQDVGFRIGEDVVGIKVYPAAEHEDPRD